MLRIAGDANRHIHRTNLGQPIAKRQLLHAVVNLLRAGVRLFIIGTGKQNQKLFATVAECQATVMCGPLNNRRHAFDHLIASLVTEAVVNTLEVIDVDHHAA